MLGRTDLAANPSPPPSPAPEGSYALDEEIYTAMSRVYNRTKAAVYDETFEREVVAQSRMSDALLAACVDGSWNDTVKCAYMLMVREYPAHPDAEYVSENRLTATCPGHASSPPPPPSGRAERIVRNEGHRFVAQPKLGARELNLVQVNEDGKPICPFAHSRVFVAHHKSGSTMVHEAAAAVNAELELAYPRLPDGTAGCVEVNSGAMTIHPTWEGFNHTLPHSLPPTEQCCLPEPRPFKTERTYVAHMMRKYAHASPHTNWHAQRPRERASTPRVRRAVSAPTRARLRTVPSKWSSPRTSTTRTST